MVKANKKLSNLPFTVNEKIADRAIRHALYMERYKTHVVLDLIRELNKRLEPKLIAKIQKSLDRVTVTNKQLQELFKHNGELTREEYKFVEGKLYGHVKDFNQVESSWIVKAMNESTPVAIDFALPSPAMLREIATSQLIDGATAKLWFGKLADDTVFNVNRQIQLGVVNGEGIESIVRRIKGTRKAQYSDGVLNAARHKIRSVVRTSIANASNNVRRELYQANTDVIKAVQWVATLDTRACLECMNLDGKTYDVDNVPDLPHINCRCSTVPVLKSWKELGINLKEVPESTRASMNGQVPESLTYPEWLRQQSQEVQEEALGVKRAAEFMDNRLTIKDFVNDEGKILNLEQLGLKG